jgi:hypothetical protein
MRGQLFFGAVVSLSLLALAASASIGQETAKKAAEIPSPKAGSWWMNKSTSGNTNRIELLRVEKDRFIVRMTSTGEREVPYTRSWAVLEGPGRDAGTWLRYDPPIQILAFPLVEGKTWRDSVGFQSEKRGGSFQGTASGTFLVTGKVKGWASVAVPAGTFEAVNVVLATPSNTNDCWYAPAVHRNIKCSTGNPNTSFEMVEYHLAE